MSRRIGNHRPVDHRFCGAVAIAFGIGITVSCFCPEGLLLFIAAVIITALGIMVRKC